MRATVLLVVAAGCGFAGPPIGTTAHDGGPLDVGDVDAASGQLCLGSGSFRICVPTPTAPVTGSAGGTGATSLAPGGGSLSATQGGGGGGGGLGAIRVLSGQPVSGICSPQPTT